jgi:hypothetical protein
MVLVPLEEAGFVDVDMLISLLELVFEVSLFAGSFLAGSGACHGLAPVQWF